MSFLDRYMSGERQRVRGDLVALGHQVRHAAYFGDAYAVAKETMRRVRRNVGVLVERLKGLGAGAQRSGAAS